MFRWAGFFICIILGLALLLFGLLLPSHLRAVDTVVLRLAGREGPTLVDAGLALVQQRQAGAAQLVALAAQRAWITNAHQLSAAVNDLVRREPALTIVGRPETGNLGLLLALNLENGALITNRSVTPAKPIAEFLVRSEPRAKALDLLQPSPNPLVQALLEFRSLTNTVIFPPVSSASGQALETALALAGLLADAGQLSTGLSNALWGLAVDARHVWHSQPLEQVLLDFMSLGQRFNWGQLTIFVRRIHDVETLRGLTELVRRDENVPVLYATVCLTDNASGVAKYLTRFGATGLNDLRWSLRHGAGGVNELLRRNQQLCSSRLCERVDQLAISVRWLSFVSENAPRQPWLALAEKWLLYLLGGCFLAAALHFVRPVPAWERPLEVQGLHLVRELLFALGVLLLVLLLSEPFLSQGSQERPPAFQLRLPTTGSAVAAGNPDAHQIIMNHLSLLTLLLFFVLQSLIYLACLVKLAEVRRQNVPARLRLKLLENEDHLFDAGLYLGFVGTIISLILVSLGIIKPSLMAAYSSTSFGIIFVSVFKIFHLRPLRRKLLLEAELESPVRLASSIAVPTVAPS